MTFPLGRPAQEPRGFSASEFGMLGSEELLRAITRRAFNAKSNPPIPDRSWAMCAGANARQARRSAWRGYAVGGRHYRRRFRCAGAALECVDGRGKGTWQDR